MDSLTHLPEGITSSYKALGNALNVEVVRRIAEALILEDDVSEQTSIQIEQELSVG
ncbi:hypothetical protein D3C73_1543800 [compost metagenome]